MEDQEFTHKEAAEYLGVKETTLRQARQRDRMQQPNSKIRGLKPPPYYKRSGHFIIYKKAI